MLGLGYRARLFGSDVYARAQGMFGGAGGANLDTGGGLLTGGKLGLEGQVSDRILLRLLGGYLVAPTGEFDGWTLEGGVSWTPRRLNPRPGYDVNRLQSFGAGGDQLSLENWSLQLLHKTALPRSGVLLKNGQPMKDDVQLLGLGFEKGLSERWNLALRAYGAYSGEVGGYREGQLGVQYELPVLEILEDPGTFYLFYFLGAGGGGGVDLKSGLFHQLGAGWRFRPLRNLRTGIEVATLNGVDGTFEADTLALGLTFDLTVPVQR
jgi:hypothetical protein